MTKLARELRRLRLARHWSIADVNRRTRDRVSEAMLIMYEQGHDTEPTIDHLRALARVYGVTAWSLLKAAGYVTDRDAIDGVNEMRARARRQRRRAA